MIRNRLVFFVGTITILVLLILFVNQQREMDRLFLQLAAANQMIDEQDQMISKQKSQSEVQTNERTKFISESEQLKEEIDRLKMIIRSNEAVLFGESAPIIDSSIPEEVATTIFKLYDTKERRDEKQFYAMADEHMRWFYEVPREEKILWLRDDPDQRAKAVKEEFGVTSEVRLVKVHILQSDGSITDPNLSLREENNKWILFRAD